MAEDTNTSAPAVGESLVEKLKAQAKLGGIGGTKLWELITTGKLEAVRLGGRTFITSSSLDAFIASLPRLANDPDASQRSERARALVARRKVRPVKAPGVRSSAK